MNRTARLSHKVKLFKVLLIAVHDDVNPGIAMHKHGIAKAAKVAAQGVHRVVVVKPFAQSAQVQVAVFICATAMYITQTGTNERIASSLIISLSFYLVGATRICQRRGRQFTELFKAQ